MLCCSRSEEEKFRSTEELVLQFIFFAYVDLEPRGMELVLTANTSCGRLRAFPANRASLLPFQMFLRDSPETLNCISLQLLFSPIFQLPEDEHSS